ncbi:MAG: DUF5667 domain-containing protein [Candidatus Peribacteraceae bacterium]
MRPIHPLSRLVETVEPQALTRSHVRTRILKQIGRASEFQKAINTITPPVSFRDRVHATVQARIVPSIGRALKDLSLKQSFPMRPIRLLAALEPATPQPAYHAWFRWSAAFVLVLVAFRAMPLLFLPSTQANAGVQLIAEGSGVEVYVGGVWRSADSAELLKSAVMIRTDNASTATVILNDDGVFRLAHSTTLKIHDLSDRPDQATQGPTATLVRGTIWTLGLLPPFVDGLTLETARGTLALNAGSASVTEEEGTTRIGVFDSGVTFTRGTEPTFLVAGEELIAGEKLSTHTLPKRTLAAAWTVDNLSHDAVHRSEIALLQDERQKELAGILPGSALYSMKRVAEKVDTLFALTSDARTEKQIAQANTRLSEALALMQGGQDAEAAETLVEYTTSLIALASTDDSLVRDILARTIAEETAGIGATGAESDVTNVDLLKQAVDSVAEAVPAADLALRDLEGYVLVQELALIKTALEQQRSPEEIAARYTEIRPYLSTILSEESETNPLLKREAESLLLNTSALARSSVGRVTDPVLIALESDLEKFLPAESDALTVTAEELNSRVAGMVERILLFRSPGQRYNQLLVEMRLIERDVSRGTLLRRLKAALPEALGEYVNTELKKLTDELKS